MNTPCLAYRRDAATGLPKLESFGIPLQKTEALSLEKEIGGLFEWLVQRGDGSTIAFETPLSHCRGAVQFDVTKVGRGRCPDLLFAPTAPMVADDSPGIEPEPPASVDEPAATSVMSAPWWDGFIEAIAQFIKPPDPDPVERSERAALEFVVSEPRRLAAEKPHELAPVLLAGHFLLGKKMCHRFDPKQVGFYRLASQALDEIFHQKSQTDVKKDVRRE